VDRAQAALAGAEGDGRGQRLPAARRRRQLLVAATELFGAQGYHDTSMEDIAEEAGVTKPVLYQHFPSKRDLYVELLQGVGRDLVDAVSAAAGESAPHQRILAGFVAYFHFVSEQTSAFQLLFGTGARGNDEFADVIRGLEDEIAGIISGLLDVGGDPEHRRTLAYAIVGAAEITARNWVFNARHATAPAVSPAPSISASSPGSATASAVAAEPSLGRRLPRLDPAAGDVLAAQLADLLWGGLRRLRPPPENPLRS
jgi:AcrR family transcriptional regulator